MKAKTPDIEEAVSKTLSSKKYRSICEETVRDVIAGELERAPDEKRAYGAMRRRLHRVWAGYLGAPDWRESAERLTEAFAAEDDRLIRAACREILSAHQSTRERLPHLERMYEDLFAVTGPPRSILDLACAVNPFSLRWMGLSCRVRYHAYDINGDAVDLINRYFRWEGMQPLAEHRDIVCRPPLEGADVGMLLKMYHCLESRRRGAGWDVVEEARVRWMIVSFPTRNLASRRADILGNYEPVLAERCAARGWRISTVELPAEVFLLIRKGR